MAILLDETQKFNVLNTPLDIYKTAKQYFPSVQVKVLKSDPIRVELKLSESFDALFLEKAIDAQPFCERMQDIYNKARLDRLSGTSTASLSSINVEEFYIENPLSDWQGFKRAMYEMNGGRCVDVLENYLRNPEQADTLASLGLAPEQVEKDLSESDLVYFQILHLRLKDMNSEEGSHLFKVFRDKYPKAFNLIFNEVTRLLEEKIKNETENPDGGCQGIIKRLKESVMGQDLAVETLAKELADTTNNRNGLYVFVGPTGVGKTQLARAVSKINNRGFIDFPMNQYIDESKVVDFIGSGVSYVGSTDKPHFAKELDKCNPERKANEGSTEVYEVKDAVLLFDEFEKAHPLIMQSFLTLFDTSENGGYVRFSYSENGYTKNGKNILLKYVFRNCLFICTSNLFQHEILQAFKEGRSAMDISKEFQRLNASSDLKRRFSPELLGRMTIIPFGPIPRGSCFQGFLKIGLLKLFEELKGVLPFKDIDMENEKEILSLLEKKHYEDGIGLRRINNNLLNAIKRKIIENMGGRKDLKNIKISFFAQKEKLFTRKMIYIDYTRMYHEIGEPLLLPEDLLEESISLA